MKTNWRAGREQSVAISLFPARPTPQRPAPRPLAGPPVALSHTPPSHRHHEARLGQPRRRRPSGQTPAPAPARSPRRRRFSPPRPPRPHPPRTAGRRAAGRHGGPRRKGGEVRERERERNKEERAACSIDLRVAPWTCASRPARTPSPHPRSPLSPAPQPRPPLHVPAPPARRRALGRAPVLGAPRVPVSVMGREREREQSGFQPLSIHPSSFLFSLSPPLSSYHNFLSADETAHLIALAKPYMAKSRVVDNVSGEEKPSKCVDGRREGFSHTAPRSP